MNAPHLPHLNEGQKTNLVATLINLIVIIVAAVSTVVSVTSYVSRIADRLDPMERRIEALERTKDQDHDLLTRLDAKLSYVTVQLDRLVAEPRPRQEQPMPR